MGDAELVAKWHNNIIEICGEKLGRALSSKERQSITQHEGFLALEMIEDTVSHAQPNELERYLVSIAVE
jgi:hypothetical protein